jgi:predicted DsbA family dithiol-disulfide isomerase
MSAPADPKARVDIDIFSDVMCPWCVIGYRQLEQALTSLAGEIEAEVRWRPFELNPDMPAEGEDLAAHMMRKYGRAPDESATGQMVAMAARAGYDMRYLGGAPEPERRLWNTFLAHKLLRWALATAGPAAQTRLKLALFDAHFQRRRNVSDGAVLLDIARAVGLDPAGAEAALRDEGLAREVRAEEQQAREMEINAVPTMIVDGRYLIPGAQEPETYASLLRRIVARRTAHEQQPGSSAAGA